MFENKFKKLKLNDLNLDDFKIQGQGLVSKCEEQKKKF